LSGPAAMVGAMRKMLVEADVNEDNIKTEEFSGY
jgi:ferredoxin-NADP reductase